MARAPLSELDDWQLEHEDQDLRGHTLIDQDGRSLGRIDEMIVDTDAERVVAIRLDNGREFPTSAFEIRDENAVLLPGSRAAGAAKAKTIPLVEERLRAIKRPVQTGEVTIHKEVETEQKTIEVPLTREEVHVERRDVEPRPAGPADRPIAPDDETIRIPVMAEQAVVEKHPVVTGEVVVSKQPVQETEQVSDTVRRTDVDVEREGEADVRDEATTRGRRKPSR